MEDDRDTLEKTLRVNLRSGPAVTYLLSAMAKSFENEETVPGWYEWQWRVVVYFLEGRARLIGQECDMDDDTQPWTLFWVENSQNTAKTQSDWMFWLAVDFAADSGRWWCVGGMDGWMAGNFLSVTYRDKCWRVGGLYIRHVFTRSNNTEHKERARQQGEKISRICWSASVAFPFGGRRRRRSLCIFVVVSMFPTLDRPKPAHCSSFLK